MLLFRVGQTIYGCDVGAAQEIITLRQCTRLPGAPAFVRGLVNVRGTIVTVLDLRLRLDPGRAPSDTGAVLLVRQGQRLVGVVVDEVVDVKALVVETTEATDAGGALVRGVGRPVVSESEEGARESVVVLDIEALIRQVLLSYRGIS
ncbi:MAG TPA: chemotaxis protein CheW [Gemmatimonadaceae bacterium]